MKKKAIYRCSCGHYGREIFEGAWSKECSECGNKIGRYRVQFNVKEEPEVAVSKLDKGDVNGLMKEHERISHSMGVGIHQFTDEVRKAHPGIEWRKVGNSMCPVIHNRQEKLKVMRQAGMTEFPPNYFNQREGK